MQVDIEEALAWQQEVFALLEKLALTAEQRRVVEQVIITNNHTGAVYGDVAWRTE